MECLASLSLVYGDESVKRFAVCDCYNQVQKRILLEEKQYRGRPAESRNDGNVAKVCKILTSDWSAMIEHIANEIGMPYRSVQNILKALSVCHVCVKFVPGILRKDQVDIRKVIAARICEQSVQEADLLAQIITGVELLMILKQNISSVNSTPTCDQESESHGSQK